MGMKGKRELLNSPWVTFHPIITLALSGTALTILGTKADELRIMYFCQSKHFECIKTMKLSNQFNYAILEAYKWLFTHLFDRVNKNFRSVVVLEV